MEAKIIDCVEINGKMVEVPRAKKLFEREKTYNNFLRDEIIKYFPFKATGKTANESDEEYMDNLELQHQAYTEQLEKYVEELKEAALKNKKSFKEEVSDWFTSKFTKDKDVTEEETDDKEKEEKPRVGIIRTIILLPAKAVKGIKNFFAKKNDEKATEEVKDENSDEKVKEADEELAKRVKEELNKEKDTKTQEKIKNLEKEIQELKSLIEVTQRQAGQIKKLNAENKKLVEENQKLVEENKSLRDEIQKLAISNEKITNEVNKQVREKIWKEFLEQEAIKEKELEIKKQQEDEQKQLINNILTSADFKYGRVKVFKYENEEKGTFVLDKENKTKISDYFGDTLPYKIEKFEDDTLTVSKEGIKQYLCSKINETEKTVTLSEDECNYLFEMEKANLAIDEYSLRKYFGNEKYSLKSDRNKGFVSKNIKTDINNKVIEKSYTYTKERYLELVNGALRYIDDNMRLSETHSELVDERIKKLMK